MSDPSTWPIPDLAAPRGQLDDDQIDALLKAVAPHRVIYDQRYHATLPGQELKAHLIRILGFGGFDYYSCSTLDFCEERPGADGARSGRWDAAATGEVRLVIRNRAGQLVQVIDESNVALAANIASRGHAIQNVKTSAITLALKRACLALGDQFGLSLYNAGSYLPMVGDTLERRRRALEGAEGQNGDELDVQDLAPRQLAEEMQGIDPDNPAEAARLRAYNEARTAAQADQDNNAPAPVERGDAEQCELLLAELAWWRAFAPNLSENVAARLTVAPEEASAPDLASVIVPLRPMIVIRLRRQGGTKAHEVADRYQARHDVAPLADLLGCDPAAVSGDA
uniref:Rad52/Rad22 family DNA repair protein n=1 Tax=Nonomuraea sp. CA-251285 TaxID=3240002 RepID=UPI003F49B35F